MAGTERVNASARCQHCNVRLTITGLEALGKDVGASSNSSAIQSAMGQSIFGGHKVDESFIVLDPSKQARGTHQGSSSPSRARPRKIRNGVAK